MEPKATYHFGYKHGTPTEFYFNSLSRPKKVYSF